VKRRAVASTQVRSGAAGLAAVIALLALAACADGTDGDGTSGVARSYRITYEIDDQGAMTTTEVRTVHRPFLGRVDTTGGIRITDAGVLATAPTDGEWVRIEVPIAPAGGDVRPDAVLDEALDAGIVEERGRREVAGRDCRVIALGGPVLGGTLTPIGAVEGESAVACIDDGGLVLAEMWTVDGATRRRIEAIDVEIGNVDDDVFSLSDTMQVLPYRSGGGSVRVVEDDEDPGFAERWRLATAPKGFEHAGRYAVLPPLLGQQVDATRPRVADVALLTDVWVDGADLVLVDQGAVRQGGAPPWDARPYVRRVDLGALGRGELVLDLRMSELRVTRPDGGFVRVAGTVAPARLIELARLLELEGTDD
jgi:hypothetical protein